MCDELTEVFTRIMRMDEMLIVISRVDLLNVMKFKIFLLVNVMRPNWLLKRA
jgi:hypothetical protein